MALAELPSYAHIKELRLCIKAPTDEARRPLTLKAPYAASLRELWAGEVLFAGLGRANAHALSAWLEALDGRTIAFKLPLAAGVFSQDVSYTAALASAPALGADTLSLNLSPASGTLPAGTLITVGDIDTPTFQLFEVLQDVTAAAPVSVSVAPRVRNVFTTSDPVALGDVTAKFMLAQDEVNGDLNPSHGIVTATVVEALDYGIENPSGPFLLLLV